MSLDPVSGEPCLSCAHRSRRYEGCAAAVRDGRADVQAWIDAHVYAVICAVEDGYAWPVEGAPPCPGYRARRHL